jgi:hypothetical protein
MYSLQARQCNIGVSSLPQFLQEPLFTIPLNAGRIYLNNLAVWTEVKCDERQITVVSSKTRNTQALTIDH